MTTNIDKRVGEHNRGYTKSTKGYGPWFLFFFEEYTTREEARKREIYLKSGVGKEKIKELWSRSSAACLPTGRDRATQIKEFDNETFCLCVEKSNSLEVLCWNDYQH